MKKTLMYGIFLALVLLGLFFVIKDGPTDITSASVVEVDDCVAPNEAIELVSEKNCTKVDSQGCATLGMMKVECP